MTWFLPDTPTNAPDRPIQAAPQLGWWDTAGASFEAARIPSRTAGMAWGQGAATDLLDELEKQAGIDGGLPPAATRPRGRIGADPIPYRTSRLFYTVTEARKADPRAYPGLPASQEEFDAELGRRTKEQQDELAKTLGGQAVNHWTAGLAGGLAEFATRPSTVLTLPLNLFAGPEVGLGRMLLGQGIIGAGQGAMDVADRTGTARLTGDAPPTLAEAAAIVGESAAMNSAFALAGHLLPPAVARLFKSARTGAERSAAYQAAKSALTGKAIPPGTPASAGADAIAGAEAALQAGALPDIGTTAPPGWAQIRNGIFAGESGGDFNALFGFQNRAGGAFEGVKLTEMSVDEALAFADPQGPYGQWVAAHNGGTVATPMGAYQIVGSTLRAAKEGLGLTGDELMTPELQERLGQWIYRQQGTGAWAGYQGPRASFTPGAGEAAPPVPYRTRAGYTGEGQVRIGDSTTVGVRYEVVDASTLQRATGDLQPRDRTRANSDAWISDTAARLDPAQLMPAPTADKGAPLVGPDNIIESGNGRVAAIARAYDLHPDRVEIYKQAIEAAGYQIPEGVDRPVLIARRTTDLTPEARRQAVIDAQDSGVAQMTPTEVARATARQLTPDVLTTLDPAKPLSDAANADFLRRALAALPRSARNAMFEDTGALNKLGQMQMGQALFARAWPDAALIARHAEGGAGELRSLMDALETAAPAWAALRADIEAGLVKPEMDISGFVLDAMRLIGAARDLATAEKIPVSAALDDLLSQLDLEHGAIAPLTEALVRKFHPGDKAAPARDIGGFLSRYAEEARKAGRTGDMLAATPQDILTKLDPKAFGALPADLGTPRAQPQIRAEFPDQASQKGAISADIEQADAVLKEDLQTPQVPTDPHAAYWTYKAPPTPRHDPRGNIPDAQWQSLTPGMRREIQRDFEREQARLKPPATAAEAMDRMAAGISAGQRPALIHLADMDPIEGKRLANALKDAQPFTTVDEVLAAAEKNHADLNDFAAAIGERLGMDVKRPGVKGRARIEEKVTQKYGGKVNGLADAARTGATATTMEQADAFVAALARRFHIIDEGWIVTEAGYFDRKLQVRFEDGQLGEVQIWPPGMLEAKGNGGHHLYEIWRGAASTPEEKAAAFDQMKAHYQKVADQLDPSFAEKLGFAAPRQDSAASASAADSSLARSSPSTSDTIPTEPPAGTQSLPDQNRPTPPDMAQRSEPSSKNLTDMGNVPFASDTLNMAADGSNVKPVNPLSADRVNLSQLSADWGDLTLPLSETESIRVADLLADIEEDMNLADVIEACNPMRAAP